MSATRNSLVSGADSGISLIASHREEQWTPACAGVTSKSLPHPLTVIPAKARIRLFALHCEEPWTPAFAGVTHRTRPDFLDRHTREDGYPALSQPIGSIFRPSPLRCSSRRSAFESLINFASRDTTSPQNASRSASRYAKLVYLPMLSSKPCIVLARAATRGSCNTSALT